MEIFIIDAQLSNILQVLRDKHGTQCSDRKSVAYLEAFKKLSVDSVENFARQLLRDLWNVFILKTINLTEEWKLDHYEGWLVKAMNHLELVEPYDEAVYDKCNFAEKSGPYWMGGNRPWRYDAIENQRIMQLQRKD